MALKILLDKKKLEKMETDAAALRARLQGMATREGELLALIESAEGEEAQAAAAAAVDAFDAEQTELRAALDAMEASMDQLRAAIAAAEEAQAAAAAAAGSSGGEGRSVRRQTEDLATREQRGRTLLRTGRASFPAAGLVKRAAASILSTTTGIIGPTGVGGVNDGHETQHSSIVDMVKLTDCTGMAGYKVAYAAAGVTASAITEGSAPALVEPAFGAVTFTPAEYGTLSYVSKEIRKLSPLDYESRVRDAARTGLRQKLSSLIVTNILASSLNTTYALDAGATAYAAFSPSLLSEIIMSYGGDEGVEGNSVLLLNKADLLAFARVRGSHEYLPVYSIVPDAGNPNTGIIQDNNGLSCRYCINKYLTALSTATLGSTASKHMIYGNPRCAELALWGDLEIAVSDEYKFAEGLLTIRGEVTADAQVTVNHGFVVVSASS